MLHKQQTVLFQALEMTPVRPHRVIDIPYHHRFLLGHVIYTLDVHNHDRLLAAFVDKMKVVELQIVMGDAKVSDCVKRLVEQSSHIRLTQDGTLGFGETRTTNVGQHQGAHSSVLSLTVAYRNYHPL